MRIPAATIACLSTVLVTASSVGAEELDHPKAPLSIKENCVFSDEFDAPPVAAPVGRDASNNITKWRTSLWFGSGYHRQGGGQGYYTDDFTPSPTWFGSVLAYHPFSTKDGILSITAKPMDIPTFPNLHYASGILTTIDSFFIDYGYFEIRLKCPGKPGNWTAFFLYPADDYYSRPQAKYTKWELDFLEILGSGIDKMHVTTHQKDEQNAKNVGDESVIDTGPNDDDFHVFGFDKQADKVLVYRDGKLILTKPTTSRMTSPGYLCLVLDVGKDKGWAGTPDPATYPQSLLVDYVRVYKTAATTAIGGPFASQKMGEIVGVAVPAAPAPATPAGPPAPADGTALPSSGSEKELSLTLNDTVSLKMVLIPSGKFLMGSPENEPHRFLNEGPQHEVTISKPFYMSIYTVTQEQYEAVMGKDPAVNAGTNASCIKGPNYPVQPMSYEAITEFCRKLAAKTGRKVRLNTEAEWEYACRAGTQTTWFFGNDAKDHAEYGCFRTGKELITHPVGQKKPNPWGLYDVYGNVGQVCSDLGAHYPKATESNYTKDPVIDPTGPTEGDQHIARGGGSWIGNCRSAGHRGAFSHPEYGDHLFGFRVVVGTEGASK